MFFVSSVSYATTINVTPGWFGDVIANDGKCSLREAVLSANYNNHEYLNLDEGDVALLGECAVGETGNEKIDEIHIPSGTFNLTIPFEGPGNDPDNPAYDSDDAFTGNLRLSDDVKITSLK